MPILHEPMGVAVASGMARLLRHLSELQSNSHD
jgi:hypothetical protein